MVLWLAASFPALILVLSFIRFSFEFWRVETFGGMTLARGIGHAPINS